MISYIIRFLKVTLEPHHNNAYYNIVISKNLGEEFYFEMLRDLSLQIPRTTMQWQEVVAWTYVYFWRLFETNIIQYPP